MLRCSPLAAFASSRRAPVAPCTHAPVAPAAPTAPIAPAAPEFRFHAHHSRRLFSHRRTGWGSARARRCRRRRGVARQPHSADRYDRLWKIFTGGDRSFVEPRPLLARVRDDLRRVGNDAGISREGQDLPRVRSLSTAERARPGRHQGARSTERVPAALGTRRRSARCRSTRSTSDSRRRRTTFDAVRERTAEPRGRPSAHQRRVFLGGGAEISR